MEKLEVKTPMGTLVAYPSSNPKAPGIFIDLIGGDGKDDREHPLGLAGIEVQIPEDYPEEHKLVAHIWGDGTSADTTHEIEYSNVGLALSLTRKGRKWVRDFWAPKRLVRHNYWPTKKAKREIAGG